jgi:hypothetical protein
VDFEVCEKPHLQRSITRIGTKVFATRRRRDCPSGKFKIHQKHSTNVFVQLKDLIALKQQQASVVEAQESVKQGEVTLQQGNTLMLFTIVTIIFVRTC